MRRTMANAILAMVLASASGTACGVTNSAPRVDRCQLIGGEKLPPEIGGEPQICAAIEAAVAARAPGTAYSVEVRVLSDHMLAAQVRLADGRSLPEQKLAVSDRKLSRRSIEQFARAIGEAVRSAAG